MIKNLQTASSCETVVFSQNEITFCPSDMYITMNDPVSSINASVQFLKHDSNLDQVRDQPSLCRRNCTRKYWQLCKSFHHQNYLKLLWANCNGQNDNSFLSHYSICNKFMWSLESIDHHQKSSYGTIKLPDAPDIVSVARNSHRRQIFVRIFF